jgi:O-antigen/teichoic acid export membrane protein
LRTPRKPELWLLLVLMVLPLLWFAPQALGQRTLLPADNLFTSLPWKAFAAEQGVGVPHNPLISDLILENYGWKSLIVEALRAGRPGDILWSPRLFAGAPFLAAGQHSAFYPGSLLYYVLPLWRAYGVFTWLQLGLAAVGMYLFARALRLRPAAGVFAAVAFAFSGFFIVSVNFTMVIAAAAWLPWLLAVVETMVRKQEEKGNAAFSPVPYVIAGALLVGVQALAGHVEITYYILLVLGYWSVWRLLGLWRVVRHARPVLRLAAWFIAMLILGLALGAVQLIPLYELVTQSFREGSASLQQIRDWAWPSRQILTFALPDIFGNPTHHRYFDIWARAWMPVTQNALGQPLDTIDWGVKNYVEGGNYLGLLTLLSAVLAVIAAGLAWVRGRRPASEALPVAPVRIHHVLGLTLLALLSLAFAFGTPLYALLYYFLPGYSQLHSAFRWVFPYTLAMAALAGIGMDWLAGQSGRRVKADKRMTEESVSAHPLRSGVEGPLWAAAILGFAALAAGALALGAVLVSLFAPGPFVALGDRILAASDLARERGFANGAMAWSYEAAGLARFGLMALLSGAVLVWGAEGQRRPFGGAPSGEQGAGKRRFWPYAAVGVLILDLWLFGRGFNPATDRRLLDFKPPVVAWLQERQDPAQPWRLTSFDAPGEKLLNPNAAMPYGLEDIRGYDSIILRPYARYMERIQPQWDLLYNRIAPLYTQLGDQPNYAALDNPLLDLLGTRYVVTTHTIPNAGYTLAYDGEVKVYENTGALPRAFIVGEAVAASDRTAALDRLQQVDPAHTVVVEGIGADTLPPSSSPTLREARISNRTNRELFVDVNLDDRGWLVLTDSFFDGWKAYLRPFGVEGEGVDASGESIEQQLPIYRADGAFRAVYLPEAGQWTVRFVYSPRSVLLGLYGAFLAGVTLMLLGGWWAWGRFYRGDRSEVGTVAKNTGVQVAMSLMSKGIDFAFAMLRLRVLSPSGEGSYAFAISFYGVFEIITRFGMSTLMTRDVALDRSRARSYLTNVVTLRVGLWLLSLPLMFLFAAFYRVTLDQLTQQEAQAIALFALALLFANIADAISAVFYAYEKMEYPAATSTAVALAKVAMGALVLLPPLNWGFVGLAGVSLVMNIVQVIWLYVLLRQKVLPAPTRQERAPLDRRLQRYMLRESAPLMINHLLATIFWRISQFVLRGATSAAALGIFSAGVKYLDGLNVIPAYFTLAIFPLMSRYAARGVQEGNSAGSEQLTRTYRLALQLLFMVALPIAVAFTFLATPLIRILGGAAYLPDSATALRIMIWSIPIGFVNSVTQYVLIAVNQQRYLTKAFLIGVLFTTAANLLLVPRYGYIAAAAILIPAELALFIPFAWAVHRYVAPMPWLRLLGGPMLATVFNLALTAALVRAGLPTLLALAVGFAVYAGVLFLLGTFRTEEFGALRRAIKRGQ